MMISKNIFESLYEVSISIGTSLELSKMLDVGIKSILENFHCNSALIFTKTRKKEIFYSQPEVVHSNTLYNQLIEKFEQKLFSDDSHTMVEYVDGVYYYLFELNAFGYCILEKNEEPFDSQIVEALYKIHCKLTYAIKACIDHSSLQETKAKLSEAQSIAHLGSWTTTFPSMEHHWDDEIYNILGEAPQSFEPRYKSILKRLTKVSKKEMTQVVRLMFKGEKTVYKGSIEILHKNGSVRLVEVRSRILFDVNGNIVSMVGTTLDITKKSKLEHELREESNLLKTIINNVPVRIFWKDTQLRYLGVNKLVLKDAGFEDESEMIGKNDYDFKWHERADFYRSNDMMVMKTGQPKLDFEEMHKSRNGSNIWVSTSKVPLRDEKGQIFGVLGTYNDITAKKENERNLRIHSDTLQHQANHDVLTGLANRLFFFDRLEQSIQKATRSLTKVVVLFLDIDRFKEVNDSLGHTFGDEAIKEVALRIEKQIRKSDTIARFGGDEFVILLDEITDSMVIVDIVQKLMRSMHEPIIIDDHIIYMTLSIGISIYPDDTESADNLLKNADAAMYRAKDSGRNTYRFYTEDMTEKAYERIMLETNLRLAIENEDFTLFFQPQINALTNIIIGMEVLLRWNHSNLGYISPCRFIPIAEDTGLIIPLGKWVLRESMIHMSKWNAQGYSPGILSVNISMVQLQEPDFTIILADMLQETGCRAEWLVIELTESQVMKNTKQTILTLQEISKLGIGISIDDFGTGYSSLSYLKRLPLNTLKIDRSFIEDIPGDAEDVAITKAIIALARSLNMQVIAEGVSSEAQRTFLLDNNCKYMQGYLYSKAVSLVEIEKIIKKVPPALPFTQSYDI